MTTRIGVLAGTAAITRRAPVIGVPIADDVVWQLDLDETSGAVAADTAGNQDATFVNPVVWSLNPVADDGGTAVALNGVNSYIAAPHFDILNSLDRLTILVYSHDRSVPAVGTQEILFVKTALGTPPAGGIIIERFNDNGIVVAQAKLTTTVGGAYTTLTGTTDIGLSPALIGLSIDPTAGAQLTVNGVVEASNAGLTQGMQNNSSPIRCGIYPNDAGAFDGALDKIIIVYGALSGAEILAGYPDAIGTTFGSSPVSEATCATRAGVNTTHKDLGNVTTERNLTVGGSTPYDGSGTVVLQTRTAAAQNLPMSPVRAWRFNASHDGSCLSGAAVRGDFTISERWGSEYPPSGGGGGICVGAGGGASQTLNGILIETSRAHATWEPFKVLWTSPRANDVTVRGCWASLCRDDAAENDQLGKFTIVDTLIDGCFSGVSTDNSGAVLEGAEVTLNKMLIRMQPMGSGGVDAGPDLDPGHGDIIKCGRSGNAIPHHASDCVFAVQQAANRGGYTSRIGNGTQPEGSPFYRIMSQGTLGAWENNVICWLSTPSSWLWELPPGCLLLTGAAAANYWYQVRLNFLSSHPAIPRLGSPYDDGFTIPGL